MPKRTSRCLPALAAVLALLGPAEPALAAVPGETNFQGLLLDAAGQPVNGTVDVVFTLYATAIGGAPLWTETHLDVQVDDGVYAVPLGATTPLGQGVLAGGTLHLEVAVEGETLSPRQPLLAVPYALRAEMAELADAVSEPSSVRDWDWTGDPLDANGRFDATSDRSDIRPDGQGRKAYFRRQVRNTNTFGGIVPDLIWTLGHNQTGSNDYFPGGDALYEFSYETAITGETRGRPWMEHNAQMYWTEADVTLGGSLVGTFTSDPTNFTDPRFYATFRNATGQVTNSAQIASGSQPSFVVVWLHPGVGGDPASGNSVEGIATLATADVGGAAEFDPAVAIFFRADPAGCDATRPKPEPPFDAPDVDAAGYLLDDPAAGDAIRIWFVEGTLPQSGWCAWQNATGGAASKWASVSGSPTFSEHASSSTVTNRPRVVRRYIDSEFDPVTGSGVYRFTNGMKLLAESGLAVGPVDGGFRVRTASLQRSSLPGRDSYLSIGDDTREIVEFDPTKTGSHRFVHSDPTGANGATIKWREGIAPACTAENLYTSGGVASRCNAETPPKSGAIVQRTEVAAAWGDACGPAAVAPGFTGGIKPICGYADSDKGDKKWWTLLPYPDQLGLNQTTTGAWPPTAATGGYHGPYPGDASDPSILIMTHRWSNGGGMPDIDNAGPVIACTDSDTNDCDYLSAVLPDGTVTFQLDTLPVAGTPRITLWNADRSDEGTVITDDVVKLDADAAGSTPDPALCDEAGEVNSLRGLNGAGVAETAAGLWMCTEDTSNGIAWTRIGGPA